eukprot:XP_022268436.1 basic proline-rich protein-like [Canis lupus familiaris]
MLISQAAAGLTGSTVRQRRLSVYSPRRTPRCSQAAQHADIKPMAGKAPTKGPQALCGPGGPVRGAEVDLPGAQVAQVTQAALSAVLKSTCGPDDPGGPVRGAEVDLSGTQVARVAQAPLSVVLKSTCPGDPGLPPEDPPVVAQAGPPTPLAAACSALAVDSHLDSDEPHPKCISCCMLGGSQPRAATLCVPLKHHDKCPRPPAPGIARPPPQGHRALGRQGGHPPPPSSRPASASPGPPRLSPCLLQKLLRRGLLRAAPPAPKTAAPPRRQPGPLPGSSQRGHLAILRPGSGCLGPLPPGGVAPGTRAPGEQGTCPPACVQRRRRSRAPGGIFFRPWCGSESAQGPARGPSSPRDGTGPGGGGPEVPVLLLEGVTDSVGGRLLGDRPRGPATRPHPSAAPSGARLSLRPSPRPAHRPRPTSEPGRCPQAQGPCRWAGAAGRLRRPLEESSPARGPGRRLLGRNRRQALLEGTEPLRPGRRPPALTRPAKSVGATRVQLRPARPTAAGSGSAGAPGARRVPRDLGALGSGGARNSSVAPHGQAEQLPDRALKTALRMGHPGGPAEAASPAVPGRSGARIADCTAPSAPQEHHPSAGPGTLHLLPPAARQPDEDEGAPISSREAPSPPGAREDPSSHPRTPRSGPDGGPRLPEPDILPAVSCPPGPDPVVAPLGSHLQSGA